MHQHFQLFKNQVVIKCNQSRWPFNCIGFHDHDDVGKEPMHSSKLEPTVLLSSSTKIDVVYSGIN